MNKHMKIGKIQVRVEFIEAFECRGIDSLLEDLMKRRETRR